MTEIQTLEQMNLEGSKLIDFAPAELKIFKEELDKQFAEGKGVDILKALRNARYLAEIDRRIADVKAGKNIVSFTEEEWEAFVNAQELS